ncbi:prostasin-like isoform X2 [Choristoneura fumiferana]|uniref:prostasin-like isoform X2 n=1 Tax=Choristoneura fumiferana TaxID=7141 RepID=UPI003D15B177
MRCVDGSWDHVAVCQPAAHCFWKTEHQAAASTYAVALGTVYRPWDEAMDSEAHKSDVSEIKIPFRYLGDAGHHQEDIALVFMSTPVVYHTYIRPVCIDFSDEFDRNQLQSTNSGKVSGWGLTAADGPASSLLLTTDLPYVNATKCMDELPPEFKPYLTSDKFCAGTKNGDTDEVHRHRVPRRPTRALLQQHGTCLLRRLQQQRWTLQQHTTFLLLTEELSTD